MGYSICGLSGASWLQPALNAGSVHESQVTLGTGPQLRSSEFSRPSLDFYDDEAKALTFILVASSIPADN